MRAIERFLVVFVVIALGMQFFRSPTAPIFLILGLSALGVYYVLAFPFIRFAPVADGSAASGRSWVHMAVRVLSGLSLAYAIAGFLLYMLGGIKREDVLGNSCVILAILLLSHAIGYWKTRSPFCVQIITRTGILLAVVLLAVWTLPPVTIAK